MVMKQQIQQFQKRFKKIPKIIELDHLTVTGDVYFGRNVTLRGTVISKYKNIRFSHCSVPHAEWHCCIVVANEGQRIDIPEGCILENRASYMLFCVYEGVNHELTFRNAPQGFFPVTLQ